MSVSSGAGSVMDDVTFGNGLVNQLPLVTARVEDLVGARSIKELLFGGVVERTLRQVPFDRAGHVGFAVVQHHLWGELSGHLGQLLDRHVERLIPRPQLHLLFFFFLFPQALLVCLLVDRTAHTENTKNVHHLFF